MKEDNYMWIFNSLATGLIGLLGWLWRDNLLTRANETKRAFDAQTKELDATKEKCAHLETSLNKVALELVKLEGELKLVNQVHNTLQKDVEEIKDQMLTRAEFEPRMSSLEKSIATLINEVREVTRPRASSGGFPSPVKR